MRSTYLDIINELGEQSEYAADQSNEYIIHPFHPYIY